MVAARRNYQDLSTLPKGNANEDAQAIEDALRAREAGVGPVASTPVNNAPAPAAAPAAAKPSGLTSKKDSKDFAKSVIRALASADKKWQDHVNFGAANQILDKTLSPTGNRFVSFPVVRDDGVTYDRFIHAGFFEGEPDISNPAARTAATKALVAAFGPAAPKGYREEHVRKALGDARGFDPNLPVDEIINLIGNDIIHGGKGSFQTFNHLVDGVRMGYEGLGRMLDAAKTDAEREQILASANLLDRIQFLKAKGEQLNSAALGEQALDSSPAPAAAAATTAEQDPAAAAAAAEAAAKLETEAEAARVAAEAAKVTTEEKPAGDEGWFSGARNWMGEVPQDLPNWNIAREQPNWVHAAGGASAGAGGAALLAAFLASRGQAQEDDEAYLMQQAAANAYGTGSTAPSYR